MTEQLQSRRTIEAPPAAVFAVLTDPARHQETEPGDWVRDAIDPQPLTTVGQVFGVEMFLAELGGAYQMWNQVSDLQPDRAIAWRPGSKDDDGEIRYGGHEWRYDLAPAADGATDVTLTYDWSDMPQDIRDSIGQMPPFDESFLAASLDSLAAAATGTAS